MGANQSYLTQDDVTTMLADYAQRTEIPDVTGFAKKSDIPKSADLTDFAKRSEIPTLPNLDPYAKTADLTSYAKTTDLAPYAKTTDLTSYAKTTDLAPYAKTTDLTSYAKTTDLAPYAKTTDLASYAKTADLGNGFGIKNQNAIEFGQGVAGKEGEAGKIRYQQWSDGLDIIGAGGAAGFRKVKIWDELNVERGISAGNINASGNLNVKGTVTVGGQSLNDLVKAQSVDADSVAASLSSNNTFIGNVQNNLYNSQKSKIDTSITNSLKADTAFQTAVKGAKGDRGPAGTIDTNSGFNVAGSNFINLGSDVAGKETNAGKIAYSPWGTGVLGIVGAGTQADINAGKHNRVVQIWDSLNIANAKGQWQTHFNHDGNGVNFIRGNTVFDFGGIQTRNAMGFGPYLVRFYRKGDSNHCLDAGQMGNGNTLGTMPCQSGNTYQQFYFNPATGYLKNVATNKCLDAQDNGQWRFNDCNGHQNQRFARTPDNELYQRGGCLDIGNTNQAAPCRQNENTQLRFDEI